MCGRYGAIRAVLETATPVEGSQKDGQEAVMAVGQDKILQVTPWEQVVHVVALALVLEKGLGGGVAAAVLKDDRMCQADYDSSHKALICCFHVVELE
jgi:hypothetical protein